MAVCCGHSVFSLASLLVFFGLFANNLHDVSAVAPTVPQLVAVLPKDTGESVKIASGSVEIQVNVLTSLRLIGLGLSDKTKLVLTPTGAAKGSSCDAFARSKEFGVKSRTDYIFEVEITLPSSGTYYICLKDDNNPVNNQTRTSRLLQHSGTDNAVTIRTVSSVTIPIWLQAILLALLLFMSGLFSGLNLGLMALDPTELKVVTTCGSPKEQRYAKNILPVRNHGNYLLCTLLLGNVMVNSSLTILLDALVGSGIIAVIASTAGIVVFGEILPQSVCSRHGLAIGSYTLWLTKFFMLLTFPVSFPISKILDFILGEELGTIYNRKQLLEMIKVTAEHNDLAGDEMNIISGVLNYKTKSVHEIMTKLGDCFLLDGDVALDFATITLIMESGHSRIPVYKGERTNIVGLLFVKDLAFVDPADCIPLQTVIKFYNHSVNFVWDDTNLGDLLDTFKEKHSHIAIVQRVNSEGPGDPFYEAIGLATLEDVIEEMIQSEIVDETDKYIDNKKLIANPQRNSMGKYNIFVTDEVAKTTLSPQLQLAAFQYLSTAVEAFSEERIASNVLKQLLKQSNVVVEIKLSEADEDSLVLYEKGRPAECFILIVQGHVNVTVGMENFTFIHGPFTYFCEDLLLRGKSPYLPDYTVKVADDVLFIKVTMEVYKQALLSTKLKTWETGEMEKSSAADSSVVLANDAASFNATAENSPMLPRTSQSTSENV